VKASDARYLVDAGPLVGLLSQNDQWHDWSKLTLALLSGTLFTTETALAEACHLLKSYRPALREIMTMLVGGRLQLAPVLGDHPSRVGELLEKYPKMDVGDATLVVLSEVYPEARLITVDNDFNQYRRFRNQAIPLIAPGHL
jgi:predicted nucleic acid-binding protein